MLIVEGGDNVGKTTLVKQLIGLDPTLRLLKRERYKIGQGEDIGVSYMRALLPEDGDRVRHAHSLADRLIASECIYGQLFRLGCRMTRAQHYVLDQLLVSYDAQIIWCDIPDEVIQESWAARDQLYDRSLKIAAQYRLAMPSLFSVPVYHYDWTRAEMENVRAEIVKRHTENVKDLSWWSIMPYGVGSLDPDILIVGETFDPERPVPLPFCSGFDAPGVASLLDWLFSFFPLLRSSTYLTTFDKANATVGPMALLYEELSYLAPRLVITLGPEAESAVYACRFNGDHIRLALGESPARLLHQLAATFPDYSFDTRPVFPTHAGVPA